VHGDIDVVPAGIAGAWYGDEPASTVVIAVAPSLLQRAAADMGLAPERVSVAPRHQVRDARIEHVAWALEAEDRAGYETGRLYAESLALALASHMLGHYAAIPAAYVKPPRERGLSLQQRARLGDYIEAHLDRDLSIARLASVLAISPSHLKSLFRQSTGQSVHEHVLRRRVERARMLLARGDKPASEVALEVGFAHQSHMARWMRRFLGVTPRSLSRS
jgi:AraC family transcriptional regulator